MQVDQAVAVEAQHFEVFERREGAVADRVQLVVVQVEPAQRLQVLELDAVQLPDAVVLQVQHL